MLNPNNNRLDYGSILSAPPNYELDFAIGTTYSFDLDSLVGASISLGLSEDTDTILRNNPIFLLEALRATGDKIALFCENGRIKLPKNPTPLYILLEEMVFQVNASEKGKIIKYPSFHPKFWLIRYVNENEDVIYRIIVLSRNLTFDRSWDITFSMDGKKIDNANSDLISKNESLKIFLDYLKEFSTNSQKTDKINKIIEELNFVEFDLNNNTFKDFDFIPNGIIDDISIKNYPLFNENFDDLVIISPFLSKKVIREFNKRAKEYKSYAGSDPKLYLFTRLNSLSDFKQADCDEFKIFTLKDEIIDGEFTISGESNFEEVGADDNIGELNSGNLIPNEDIENKLSNQNDQLINQQQDIHAKIYFVRKGSQVDLYLGSLNASFNALNGNLEFMIRLKTNEKKFNLDVLLADLFCGEEGGSESPFQLIDLNNHNLIIDEEKEKKDYLESILKDIVRLNFNSKISFDEEFYIISLNVDDYSIFEDKYAEADFNIWIKPLLSEKIMEFSKLMVFEKMNKNQLSEFFVINIKKGSDSIKRVIKINSQGMPNDREEDVISSVITDKTAFIKYVAFLLGDNDTSSFIEENLGIGGGHVIGTQVHLPELYEKMLIASVDHREKFKEVDYLIKILSGDNVIPDGFEDLYNTFKEVFKSN